MKQVNIKLTDTEAARFIQVYGTMGGGVAWAAKTFFNLRNAEQRNLRGYFTRQQLAVIVETMREDAFEPQSMTSAAVLLAKIDDANRYEQAAEAKGVDVGDLTARIDALAPSTIFFLQDAVKEYWSKTDRDFDALCQNFEAK